MAPNRHSNGSMKRQALRTLARLPRFIYVSGCYVIACDATAPYYPTVDNKSYDHHWRSLLGQKNQEIAGDFSELNAILERTVLQLGGGSVAEGLVLDASVADLTCRSARIANITLDSIRNSNDNRELQVNLSVVKASAVCDFRYAYRTMLFRGSGNGSLVVRASGSVAWKLLPEVGTTFQTHPPTRAFVLECVAVIQIESLQFNKGILGLAPVETLLKRILKNRAQGALCNVLTENSLLADLLEQFNRVLSPYLDGDDLDTFVLVEAETALISSSNEKSYIHFQNDPTTKEGKFLRWILQATSTFLAAPIRSSDTTGTNVNNATTAIAEATELRVNLLLRRHLQNSLTINKIPWQGFQSQDRLTNSTIQMDRVTLVGLDTIQSLEPLAIVGNYSLQTNISLAKLSVRMDATVSIRPSSADNAVLTVPGPPAPPVMEQIQVLVSWDNVQATAAVFLPLLQSGEERRVVVSLGSLLHSENLLPCLLSMLGDDPPPMITSLSVSLGYFDPPTLQGFVSKGIDRVVSSLSVAMVQMYKDVITAALPNIFQTTVRPAINTAIHQRLRELSNHCPPATGVVTTGKSNSNSIDLRDLLLQANDGSTPYGDVLQRLYNTWNDRFIQTDEFNRPKINTALIVPGTEAQSGVAGQIHFTRNHLLDYEWKDSTFPTLVDQLQVRISSPRVEHFDTIVSPLEMFKVTNAKTLHNSIRFGLEQDQMLTLFNQLLFVVESQGDVSPLATHNSFGVTVSLKVSIDIDVSLALNEQNFLNFSMDNVLNPFCWISVLENSLDDGLGLSLSQFTIDLEVEEMALECWYCTSTGGEALPLVIETIRGSDIISFCETLIERSLEESVWTYGNMVTEKLAEEQHGTKCLSSPFHEFSAVDRSEPWSLPDLPPMSVESIDAFMFGSMLAFQTLMIVIAKAHQSSDSAIDESSPPSILRESKPTRLINFMDLNATVGSWAQVAIDTLRNITESLSTSEFGTEPGFNALIRKIANAQRNIEIPFRGTNKFLMMNTTFEFNHLSIGGLDSTSSVSLFNAVGPHTLESMASLSTLEVFLNFTAQTPDSKTKIPFKLSIHLSEIALHTSSLLELDWDGLGRTEVGSILRLHRIFPCVVSKVQNFYIGRFDVDAGSLTSPKLWGVTDELIVLGLKSLDDHLFQVFHEDIRTSIPIMLNTTARNVVNTLLSELMFSGDVFCSYNASALEADNAIDFRDLLVDQEQAERLGGSGKEPYGNTFPKLLTMVRLYLGADDHADSRENGLNAIIRSMSLKQSHEAGVVYFKDIVVDQRGHISLANWDVNYLFQLRNVLIRNLDSVGPRVFLLQPVLGSPHTMNNSISVGTNSRPITLTADVFFYLFDSQGNAIENDVTVELTVEDLVLMTLLEFQVSELALLSTPLSNLLNHFECWMATVVSSPESPKLEYSMEAAAANLTVSCKKCKTSRFDELMQRLYEIGDSDEEVASFVATIRNLADLFLNSDFIHHVLTVITADAKRLCPSSPQYDPKASESSLSNGYQILFNIDPMRRDPRMKIFNIVSGALLFTLVTVLLVVRNFLRVERTKWRHSQPDRAMLLQQYEDSYEAQSAYLNQHTGAIHFSTSIPRCIRYCFPTLLLLNMVLYFVAHFATLTYVNIDASIAGDQIKITRFIELSFFQSAMATYRSGGNEMALMIIIFSGVWPYIKILISLFLWFADPKIVSVRRRKTVFVWLDVFTKLSIVDIAMAMMVLATALLFVGGQVADSSVARDLYSLSLVIVPRAGFYCILIAQRLNRVSSTLVLEYQEAIEQAAIKMYYEHLSMKKSDEDPEPCMPEETTSSCLLETKGTAITLLSDSTSVLSRNSALLDSNKSEYEKIDDQLSSELSERSSRVIDERTVYCRGTDLDQTPWQKLCGSFEVSGWTKQCLANRQWTLGAAAATLACLCIFIVFIIACVMAPSLVVDAKDILGITIESGRSFNETIASVNVYKLICSILLSSRFVLLSRTDYFGLITLVVLAVVTTLLMPLVQVTRGIQRWCTTHSFAKMDPKGYPSESTPTIFSISLVMWPPLIVYVIAFCIAIWQLGAVWAFVIHSFCSLSGQLFTALQYVGMVQEDDVRVHCFRVQASALWSLVILFISCGLLVATFISLVVSEFKTADSIEDTTATSSDNLRIPIDCLERFSD